MFFGTICMLFLTFGYPPQYLHNIPRAIKAALYPINRQHPDFNIIDFSALDFHVFQYCRFISVAYNSEIRPDSFLFFLTFLLWC